MMETDVRKILQTLADTATNAAEEARGAVQSAKKGMAEKYDAVRLGIEHSRLQTQQERLFADIGRTMFLLRSGTLQTVQANAGADEKTPQQVIESLLLNAEQVQQALDAIAEKLSDARGERTCPLCGRLCVEHDTFCAVCGTKL